MNLTIKNLQERYSLNSKQSAIAILKEHYEELNANGEYVKYTKGNWIIDEKSLPAIDKIMGFVPPKVITLSALDELTKRAEDAEATLEQLQSENATLRQALSSARLEAEQNASESRELQNKYLAIQEGAESDRAAMVRKASLRAEKAENELSRYREKYEHLVVSSDEQVKSLTTRIEDLMSQLATNHGVMEQKVKADFEAMRARKEAERLYDEIHEKEQRLSDLNLSIRELEESKADAQNQLRAIRLQINAALNTVGALEDQLKNCLDAEDDSATATVEKKPAVVAEPISSENTVSGLSAQDIQRQQLMDEMREEQATDTKHKKTFWKRVASFF